MKQTSIIRIRYVIEITLIGLLITGLSSCKKIGSRNNTLLSGDDCLLNETISSLEIITTVAQPHLGYVDFDYTFRTQDAETESKGFTVPFVASKDEIVTGSNGIHIIGHHMSQGLTVKDQFHQFLAQYTSECMEPSRLATKTYQNHSITVLVNNKSLVESDFELVPEMITQGCTNGQSAHQLTLQITDLNSNHTFAHRTSECNATAT